MSEVRKTTRIVAEVVSKEYEDGVPVPELLEKYGISYSTLKNYRKLCNVEARERRRDSSGRFTS